MTIGEKIKQYRESRKMSQNELARALGYKTGSTITKIEKNINCPPISKLRVIADYFGVDVWELIGFNEVVLDDIPDTPAELQTIFDMLKTLTPTELQRVHDFILGLIAARS